MTRLMSQNAAGDIDDTHTLAGEHFRLMRGATRRAAPVLALLDAPAWPHAELDELAMFLRSAVLRQVSDEEVHLFPHDSSAPPFAELSSDHARLHALTARLEDACAEPCSRAELRALVEELLAVLRRHLAAEERVLAELRTVATEVPGVGELAAGHRAWLPDDEAPVRIELDSLPAAQASELCIERLLRLPPGQTARLNSRDGRLLQTVGRWLYEFDAARFGFEHRTVGGDHLLWVTCRDGNTPAGIGYPG